MTKNDIKRIIVALFKDNYRRYPENYTHPSGAIFRAIEAAKSYWDNRNEQEIERDKKAHVIFAHYRKWVLEELKELVTAK